MGCWWYKKKKKKNEAKRGRSRCASFAFWLLVFVFSLLDAACFMNIEQSRKNLLLLWMLSLPVYPVGLALFRFIDPVRVWLALVIFSFITLNWDLIRNGCYFWDWLLLFNIFIHLLWLVFVRFRLHQFVYNQSWFRI